MLLGKVEERAEVVAQLKSLARDRKSFFRDDGDDEIFRADYAALMRAVEMLEAEAKQP